MIMYIRFNSSVYIIKILCYEVHARHSKAKERHNYKRGMHFLASSLIAIIFTLSTI